MVHFATEHPYVPLEVTPGDMQLASLAFGFTVGFTYFVACHAVRETKRAGRLNTYVFLIWSEIAASSIFALICWLYIQKVIPPSFGYFIGIVVCWAVQVQILLQVIVNRICILLPNERKRNKLRYGVAGFILLINITVFSLWVPAQLQISDRYIMINRWWDRCEKIIYLIIDGLLNFYFIYTVKQRLVSHGLTKYNALVRFNIQIISVSMAMDVMILGCMFLRNPYVYVQFHPVAYIVKLNIEMAMTQLIVKVATGTGIEVFEDLTGSSSGRREDRTTKTGTGNMEVLVNRQVHTQHDAEDIQLERRWSSAKAAQSDADDTDADGSIHDRKAPVV